MQGYWTQFRVWYVKSNLCVAKLENANIQWNTHNLKNIKTLLHGTSLIYFPLQFKIPVDLVDEMPVTDYRKQSTYCRRKPRKRAKRERKNISLTNSQHGEKTEEKENGRLSAMKKSCLLNLYEYTLKNQWNMNKKRVNLPGRVVRRLYISRNLEFSITFCSWRWLYYKESGDC